MILFADFDSTFIQSESLDVLAMIAGCDNNILTKITQLTDQAMNGELSFCQALNQRLALINLTQQHVDKSIEYLKNNISPSFVKNKSWLIKNSKNIIILSGGFKKMIEPIVAEFGIKANQVYANDFRYNAQNQIIGIDHDNPLAHDNGKAKAVEKFFTLGEEAIILGDGYNDYLLKKSGLAKQFYLFTENIHRKNLEQYADRIISSLDEITELFKDC